MFKKLSRTDHPPSTPLLIWDGSCGFCKYWVLRWKKGTSENVDFEPYQEVADRFSDIPLDEFKKATRLIEPDGQVFNGPEAVYRCLQYRSGPHIPWYRWYRSSSFFRISSDKAYQFISNHRDIFYSLTRLCFGKDPLRMKPYWVLWLLLILAILYMAKTFL